MNKDTPCIGDLAVVVKWPCCGSDLGKIILVRQIRDFGKVNAPCEQCGVSIEDGPVALQGFLGWPIAWLKRIPPLEELDKIKEVDELHV